MADEALVIRNGDGTFYAIPRSVVEQYKLTTEQAAALSNLPTVSGGEVEGYAVKGAQFGGQPGVFGGFGSEGFGSTALFGLGNGALALNGERFQEGGGLFVPVSFGPGGNISLE